MKPRIRMITLGVRDLSAAIEFYEKGLGCPRLDSSPDVAFFTLPGTWLGLYGRVALAEDAKVSPEAKGFESFLLRILFGFSVPLRFTYFFPKIVPGLTRSFPVPFYLPATGEPGLPAQVASANERTHRSVRVPAYR